MCQKAQNKYHKLRKLHPVFVYEGFNIEYNKNKLQIVYSFKLNDAIIFNPSLSISFPTSKGFAIHNETIEVLAFHLGMVEMISYWKATCSPQIIIKPYRLTKNQLLWWKKLFYHGLGEFFQINKIFRDFEDFVTISCENDACAPKIKFATNSDNVLVPIGGGKDSNVTMELLKNDFRVIPFIINPRKASLDSVKAAGFKETDIFIIKRIIDPQLLKLNAQGYLNGHTPFSAMVAFSSLIAAYFTNSKHIALSNESSANENTDLVSGVNHQYSKSFEFENDFRSYVADYINEEINYFSFLRPVSEFQIAKLFSEMKKYQSVFRSCNVGSKKDEWCGKCSKCLFTYIILSPFLSKAELIKIYGNDLLDDPDLFTEFMELTGQKEVKPFECVGTIEEVNVALELTISGYNEKLPYLLSKFEVTLSENEMDLKKKELLKLENEHFLNPVFYKILKDACYA